MAWESRTSILLTVLMVPAFCWAGEWTDPQYDQFPFATPPELDLVGVSASFAPGQFVVTLSFDPASATPEDLLYVSGFIDLDVDQNAGTGRLPHVDEFGLDPVPVMGVDYYLELYPGIGFACLVYVDGYDEYEIDYYEFAPDGSEVTIALPCCQSSPYDGICLRARYDLVVLVGNGDIFTDRGPNDDNVYTAEPSQGDFDEDGAVDMNDVTQFEGCATGPAVPYDPQGLPAGCMLAPDGEGILPADLDEDGDIDHEDFGLLQRNLTGELCSCSMP